MFPTPGCREFRILINHGVGSAGTFMLWSVDGVTSIRGEEFTGSALDSNPSNVFAASHFGPYVGVRLKNNGSGGQISAYVYCLP